MIIKERIQRTDGSIYYREYLKKERLGKGTTFYISGGFAECFVAERISDKKKYALKIISKKLLEKPKARQKVSPFILRCYPKSNCTVKQNIKIFATWKGPSKTNKTFICFYNYAPMGYVFDYCRTCSS